MNVPDEAIEAAARVAYAETRSDMAGYGFDAPKSFDKLLPDTKAYFREKVRPLVEAAAPSIAKQARTEGVTVSIKPRWCRANHEVTVTWPGPKYTEGY